jgi:cysteine desulfurase
VSRIYLDNAASTPMAPPVLDAIVNVVLHHANPSSPHPRGRRARLAVDRVREQLADLFAASPHDVTFTSGATEAINTVFASVPAWADEKQVVLVAPTEHKAVLESASQLSELHGIRVEYVPIDRNGLVDLDAIASRLVENNVAMVAVMAVNNESGVIQPIARIAQVCSSSGVPFLCDSTQAVGKIEVDAGCVDFAIVSAHKLHGPTGIGALIARPPWRDLLRPLLRGGNQERGLRPGTTNLLGVVGLGAALEYVQCVPGEVDAVSARFVDTLLAKCPRAVTVNAESARRVPHIVNLWIEGVDADTLLARVQQVDFATGSACNSDLPVPSHVLRAMGLTDDQARASVRFSFSRLTALDEAERAAVLVAEAVADVVAMEGES